MWMMAMPVGYGIVWLVDGLSTTKCDGRPHD